MHIYESLSIPVPAVVTPTLPPPALATLELILLNSHTCVIHEQAKDDISTLDFLGPKQVRDDNNKKLIVVKAWDIQKMVSF
jgi:hypothetical protein